MISIFNKKKNVIISIKIKLNQCFSSAANCMKNKNILHILTPNLCNFLLWQTIEEVKHISV